MKYKKRKPYSLMILLWRIFKKKPLLALLVFFSPLLSGFLTMYTYLAQVKIIDIIIQVGVTDDWKLVLFLTLNPLLLYTLIFVLQEFFNGITNVARADLNSKVTLAFRADIADITSNCDFLYFDNEDFCNKLERAKAAIGEDLVGITTFATRSIKILASLLSIIWLAGINGYFSVVFVVLVMIIVNLYIRLCTEIKVRRNNRELTLEGRVGDYLSNILTDTSSISEMRIYNSTEYFLNLWGEKITKQHSKRYGARRLEIKMGLIVTIIQVLSILFVLMTLLDKMQFSDKVTVGSISILFLALLGSGNKIMNLTWDLSKLYVSSTKLYDLNYIIKLKDLIKEKKIKNESKDIYPIKFRSVDFSYNSSKLILKNLNLTINKYDKIAIVGGNGAGKSTLIKLILGLYQPNLGAITFNNKEGVPENISVVFQSFLKFDLSLRENIGLGNIKEIKNDKLILDTLKKCELEDLYNDLGSLDAPLGRLVQEGREVSGGQWQKIAIARAIFSDAELLIFDEPTASIDPNAEAIIFNKIMEICKNKTAIFISHRLGWAKNADRIVVMDSGKIIEEGRHEGLLQLEGKYEKLYKMQASWYT